jgi:hypothetical protein
MERCGPSGRRPIRQCSRMKDLIHESPLHRQRSALWHRARLQCAPTRARPAEERAADGGDGLSDGRRGRRPTPRWAFSRRSGKAGKSSTTLRAKPWYCVRCNRFLADIFFVPAWPPLASLAASRGRARTPLMAPPSLSERCVLPALGLCVVSGRGRFFMVGNMTAFGTHRQPPSTVGSRSVFRVANATQHCATIDAYQSQSALVRVNIRRADRSGTRLLVWLSD